MSSKTSELTNHMNRIGEQRQDVDNTFAGIEEKVDESLKMIECIWGVCPLSKILIVGTCGCQ